MDTTGTTALPAALRAIDDPAARAQAAGHLLQLLADVQAEVKAIRAADVAEMRKTMKLREIAELLDVSMARVDQIARSR